MTEFKKFFSIISASILMIVGFTGCSEEIQSDPNVLRVGSSIDFPPFEFQDDTLEDFQGFDMDLIRAIGKELNKDVEIKNIHFNDLTKSLQSNEIDVIISGMTINDERRRYFLFSEPYYQSGLTIVIRSDNTNINSFADLIGKKIAVRVGTTSANEAKNIPDTTVKELRTPADCFIKLQSGEVDAVINDRPVNEYAIVQGGIQGVRTLPERLTSEDYGIAIDRDNKELQNQINVALQNLRDNGEYDKIYSKWFGHTQN